MYSPPLPHTHIQTFPSFDSIGSELSSIPPDCSNHDFHFQSRGCFGHRNPYYSRYHCQHFRHCTHILRVKSKKIVGEIPCCGRQTACPKCNYVCTACYLPTTCTQWFIARNSLLQPESDVIIPPS